MASEALECFGGVGYVEDTGIPRLLRDAQVLPIWEGTTNVLALDALRAIDRESALEPFLARSRERLQAVGGTDPDDDVRPWSARIDELGSAVSRTLEEAPETAREITFRLVRVLAAGLLAEQAAWARTRDDGTAGSWRRACGTSTTRAATHCCKVYTRALPLAGSRPSDRVSGIPYRRLATDDGRTLAVLLRSTQLDMNRPISNPIVLEDMRLSRRWQNHSYLQPAVRHELAGPQNALALHVQLLSRAAAKGELETDRVRRWVGVLETELERLYRLSEASIGILAPDRPDPAPAPVARIWSELQPFLAPRARELRVRLEMEGPEDLTVPIGGRQLEDLLLDLTVESLERLEAEQSKEGSIEWTVRHEGGDVILTRRDGAASAPDDGGESPITEESLVPDGEARPRLISSKALVGATRGRWTSGPDDGGHLITIQWPLRPEEGS